MLNFLSHDFATIPDGGRIILYPSDANFVQRQPCPATRLGNGFHLDGSNLPHSPEYTMGDIHAFCEGWEPVAEQAVAK